MEKKIDFLHGHLWYVAHSALHTQDYKLFYFLPVMQSLKWEDIYSEQGKGIWIIKCN